MLALSLPETITAEYKIILPMFLGGVDKKVTKISPLSVKGVLRFWWRAQAWPRYAEQEADDVKALKALHLEEAQLFGTTAEILDMHNARKNIKSAGKGMVRISVEETESTASSSNDKSDNLNSDSSSGAKKAASGKTNSEREAFQEGKTFIITLYLGKTGVHTLSDLQKEELIRTLKLLGLFGGLGARSRRGFGSIQLQKLNGKAMVFSSVVEFRQSTIKLLSFIGQARRAPFTAFSKDTEWAIRSDDNSWVSQAGTSHEVLTKAYKEFSGKNSVLTEEQKQAFGLPRGDATDRRASPYLFHTCEVNNQYSSQILYLPSSSFHYDSQLSPDNEKAAAKFLQIWSNQGGTR